MLESYSVSYSNRKKIIKDEQDLPSHGYHNSKPFSMKFLSRDSDLVVGSSELLPS